MGMKVTIVGGAGTVGTCTAHRIAQDGVVSELVLVDSRRNVAEAHALDLDEAMAPRTGVHVRGGEVKDAAGSDIIIMAVGIWGRPTVASRSLQIEHDLKLLMELMPPLIRHSPSALWIIVTAPVDVLVYWIHRTFSIPRTRVVGFNQNDTARLRSAIGKVLSVPAGCVEAFVLGEHGETQVPILSNVKIRGEKVFLEADQREQVKIRTASYLTDWNKLQSGRTAGWTTGESLGDMVRSIAADDGTVFGCSSVLQGEYGLEDVSLGVPVRLGREGVKEIIEIGLDAGEREGLRASASTLQKQCRHGEAFVKASVQSIQETLTAIEGGMRS